MKHLKRFNESLTDDEVEELKDFCESSLAYLLDDGYYVYIQREWNVGFHVLFGLPNDNFFWNDVKDYYIPFLQLLSRRYKLVGRVNQVLVSSTDGENYYSYDYLTKDGYKGFRHVIEDYEINSIILSL